MKRGMECHSPHENTSWNHSPFGKILVPLLPLLFSEAIPWIRNPSLSLTCSGQQQAPLRSAWHGPPSWRRSARAASTLALPCQATACSGTAWPHAHWVFLSGSPERDQMASNRHILTNTHRALKQQLRIQSLMLVVHKEAEMYTHLWWFISCGKLARP